MNYIIILYNMQLSITQIYNVNIYNRYLNLKNSNKTEYDNYDLAKIFEYFSCIKLSEEFKTNFYEYNDIDPEFKEINDMSKSDTGIDCSNLINTIVQCKLRQNNLTWKECATFFASQNMFNNTLNKTIVRWQNLIITRNDECLLSKNLLEKNKRNLFIDKTYNKQELLNFCENLYQNPPTNLINNVKQIENKKFELRDYQIECVNLIQNSKKNVIISLPTGTGKNTIIIHSFEDNKKYLILVPRIILMEQLKEEIIKLKPTLKNQIQFIGDSNNKFNVDKNITICVFNSIGIIADHCNSFTKIYVDEAHHINKPEIYYDNDDDDDCSVDSDDSNDSDDSDDSNDSDDSDDSNDSDDSDDSNDSNEDLKNTKKYITIISDLTKHNNNVYLSATIDRIDNFDYYSKDIREMINLKHLCDYTIQIPIFSDDPTNANICKHLIQNYTNIIIYCNTQKEGIAINNLLNTLQNNISEYIDCNTPKTKRNKIINKYKEGKLSFLVNVRILVEGFDAPITKGVCFLHLPSNKTTIIQIIGRCLRLHSNKTIANVILPFSSIEDENSICSFLKIIAFNDKRIKKSYDGKKLNGYITIDTINNNDEIENNDVIFKYNQIYNSIGVLTNGEEIWKNKLEKVKKYIDENNKRPSDKDKNKDIKILGSWVSNQTTNYNKKEQIMKIVNIYNTWTEFINDNKYKKYVMSNEDAWLNNLNLVKKYIDENNKKPSYTNKNKDTKILGTWLSTQTKNYNKKEYIMKTETIYNTWTEFINDDKYKKYVMSNEDAWFNNLNLVKKYIDKNNKTPSAIDKNKDIKILSTWLLTQTKNYNKKEQIMKTENIYNTWIEFINDDKYKKYFITNEDTWVNNLNLVKKYIDENNKTPSYTDKNKDIKILGCWISNQTKSYDKKEYIMKTENIYNTWTEFINNDRYKKYFISNEDAWLNNLNLVKKYIDENNKKPMKHGKNNETKILGEWISTQTKNYNKKEQIMKTENIYDMWTEFINNNKYKKYFISNEDTWLNNLNLVKKYIDENNKKPSTIDKNKDTTILGYWLSNQITNYNKKEYIMKTETIYNTLTEFINDDKYKNFFI